MPHETVAELRARNLSARRREGLEQLVAHVGVDDDGLLDVQGAGGEVSATASIAHLTETRFAMSPLASSISSRTTEMDVLKVMFDAATGEAATVDADQAPRIEALQARLGISARSRANRAVWAVILELFGGE